MASVSDPTAPKLEEVAKDGKAAEIISPADARDRSSAVSEPSQPEQLDEQEKQNVEEFQEEPEEERQEGSGEEHADDVSEMAKEEEKATKRPALSF